MSEFLRENGYESYLDIESLRAGDTLTRTIARYINAAARVVVLLSERSIKRRWVQTEIEWALTREINEAVDLIVPVCMDAPALEWLRKDLRLGSKLAITEFREKNADGFASLLVAMPPVGNLGWGDVPSSLSDREEESLVLLDLLARSKVEFEEGRSEEALKLAVQAEEEARRCGLDRERARSLEVRSGFLERQGDKETSRELLLAAQSVYPDSSSMARVVLDVVDGPIEGGVTFTLDGHDTFIFGRASDCHARLPEKDPSASRHHFILEANPPLVRLRDLGSLNGTWVNEVKCGGRNRNESAEEARGRVYPEVDIQDGDRIRVGETVFNVTVLEAEGAPEVEVDQEELDLVSLLSSEAGASGRVLSGYRVEREIDRGGMGAVYLAVREADGASVAMKVLLSQGTVSEIKRQRFLREISILRHLSHPSIVAIEDYGSVGSSFYFAMEYCAGGSAFDLVKRHGGKVALDEACPLMLKVLEGLAFAHRCGHVHRDLKPGNILLRGVHSSSAKISDFGLAKNMDEAGLSGLTATNTAAGTPLYMPMEQLTHFKHLEPVSDVWSCAATFYYVLTGFPPRECPPGMDPIAAVLRSPVDPLRKRAPEIPSSVAKVIDRALAKHVEERFADASAFLEALTAVL